MRDTCVIQHGRTHFGRTCCIPSSWPQALCWKKPVQGTLLFVRSISTCFLPLSVFRAQEIPHRCSFTKSHFIKEKCDLPTGLGLSSAAGPDRIIAGVGPVDLYGHCLMHFSMLAPWGDKGWTSGLPPLRWKA